MKKFFLACFGILFLAMCGLPASAHELLIDRTVNAILHVDPDDNPVVNQPAHFILEVTDTQGVFHAPDCDCTVRIEQDGKDIFTQKIPTTNTNPFASFVTFSYTFAEQGTYHVSVTGTSLKPGLFHAFSVGDDIDVSRGAPAAHTIDMPAILNYPIFFVSLAAVILAFLLL